MGSTGLMIILTVLSRKSVGSELCQKSTGVGDSDFRKHSDNLDQLSGVLYLVSSDLYRFPCCGLIHAVKTHTLINGVVRFLVWRPTDETDRYTVVGDFKIEVSNAPHSGSVLPSGSLQLQVQPGDLIGWYNPSDSSIPYVDGELDGHVNILPFENEPSLGDVVDFGAATKETGRIYAIGANLDEDSNIPEFKGTPDTVQISADVEVGSYVAPMNVFDPQYQDAVISISENPYFEVHRLGRSISVKAVPMPGEYQLALTSKSLCGLSASFAMTITVNEVTTSAKAITETVDPAVTTAKLTSDIEDPDWTQTNSLTDQASDTTTVTNDNITVNAHIISPNESKSDLWKVFAGLAASIVLVSCITIILRYAWILYGGRFKAKTATDTLKVPETNLQGVDKDPENGDLKQEPKK